ncbi:MAG TPA: hypothetical protein VFR70_11005, partial [Flavobacterium sp.]|nr:hypothetical protein [Flavobacterium sp.]
MKKICIIFMLLSAILYACNSARRTSDLKLPAEKYTAYPLGYSHKIIGDSLVVSLNNVLECPVRVVLNDTSLNKKFERNGFVVLNPKEKKTVSVFLNGVKKYNSEIRYMLGRPAEHPKIVQLSLPFPKGKK